MTSLIKLDLLEYGNPTEHQRGREKLTYGDGGTCTHVTPLVTPLRTLQFRSSEWPASYITL